MAPAGGIVAAEGRAIRRVVGREQTSVESRRSNDDPLSYQRSVQRADEAAGRDRTIATGGERSSQAPVGESTVAHSNESLRYAVRPGPAGPPNRRSILAEDATDFCGLHGPDISGANGALGHEPERSQRFGCQCDT